MPSELLSNVQLMKVDGHAEPLDQRVGSLQQLERTGEVTFCLPNQRPVLELAPTLDEPGSCVGA